VQQTVMITVFEKKNTQIDYVHHFVFPSICLVIFPFINRRILFLFVFFELVLSLGQVEEKEINVDLCHSFLLFYFFLVSLYLLYI